MNWFEDIEDENWSITSEETKELDEDEISLREAAFMEGYEDSRNFKNAEEERD